jgi:hypothetical protein
MPLSLPQRLLRLLSESALPLPTPDIVAALGYNEDRAYGRVQVFVALKRLRLSGLVTREIRPRATGDRYRNRKLPTAFWRLT